MTNLDSDTELREHIHDLSRLSICGSGTVGFLQQCLIKIPLFTTIKKTVLFESIKSNFEHRVETATARQECVKLNDLFANFLLREDCLVV